MKIRRLALVIVAVSAMNSPVANAFWLFQNRAASVVNANYSHHRHHRHRYYHHKRYREYRRIITEYRIYYVPVPTADPSRGSKQRYSQLKSRAKPKLNAPRALNSPPNYHSGLPVTASSPQMNERRRPNQSTGATGQRQGNRLLDKFPPNALAVSATGSTTAAGVASSVLDAGINVNPTSPHRPGVTHTQDNHFRVKGIAVPTETKLAAFSPPPVHATLDNRSSLRNKNNISPSSLIAIAAAVVALAGLIYAVRRQRKGGIAARVDTHTKRLVPHTNSKPEQNLPDAKTTSLPPSRPQSFNFDEIWRVNVARAMFVPVSGATVGSGMMVAAPATNLDGHTKDSAPVNEGHSEKQAVVQHAYGDVMSCVVTELYDTPESKAGLAGFYEHIPAQFHDSAWLKVVYNNGHNFTFAITAPGINVLLFDEVKLVFGQQDPPIPNQVVAVIRSANTNAADEQDGASNG